MVTYDDCGVDEENNKIIAGNQSDARLNTKLVRIISEDALDQDQANCIP